MNEVSSKVYKFDFQFIYDNFLDQRIWKKKWLIFKYGDISIYVQIFEISIYSNSIRLAIVVEYTGKLYDIWSRVCMGTLNMPLDEANRNKTTIENGLVGTAIRQMRELEERVICTLPGYVRAKELDDQSDEKNKKIAKGILDKLGIKDKRIRKAFIEKYMDDNREDYRYDYARKMQYKIWPEYYLAYIAYADENNNEGYTKKMILENSSDPAGFLAKVEEKTSEEMSEENIKKMIEDSYNEYKDSVEEDE